MKSRCLTATKTPTYADGATGAIYGQYPPLVNACRKPGEWQVYDIIWIAPRFEGDSLKSPARVTVLHNGILLHHDKELLGPTQHRKLAEYVAHPPVGSLHLQDHGDLRHTGIYGIARWINADAGFLQITNKALPNPVNRRMV